MNAESVWLIIIASVVVASVVFGIRRMRQPLWPRSQATSPTYIVPEAGEAVEWNYFTRSMYVPSAGICQKLD